MLIQSDSFGNPNELTKSSEKSASDSRAWVEGLQAEPLSEEYVPPRFLSNSYGDSRSLWSPLSARDPATPAVTGSIQSTDTDNMENLPIFWNQASGDHFITHGYSLDPNAWNK